MFGLPPVFPVELTTGLVTVCTTQCIEPSVRWRCFANSPLSTGAIPGHFRFGCKVCTHRDSSLPSKRLDELVLVNDTCGTIAHQRRSGSPLVVAPVASNAWHLGPKVMTHRHHSHPAFGTALLPHSPSRWRGLGVASAATVAKRALTPRPAPGKATSLSEHHHHCVVLVVNTISDLISLRRAL